MTASLDALSSRHREAVLNAVVAVEESAEPVSQRRFPALADPALRELVGQSLLGAGRALIRFGDDAWISGYDDTIAEFTKYDAGAAKKLLADAGSANGFSTDLWYAPASRSALPDPKRIAESIAADLAKIGISVSLRTADASTLGALSRAGSLPLWIDDRTADRADPADFFDGVSTDPVANELLRRAGAEPDASKRGELYKQVTKMFQRQIPRIPLFHASPAIALTRKLPGLIPQPIVGESFAGVWIGR